MAPRTRSKNKVNEKPSNGNPKTKSDTDLLSKPKAATMRTKLAKSRNKEGRPLVDFHNFAMLPREMQDEVWETACYKAVTIQILVGEETVETVGAVPFKVPGVMQATSGSRGIALKRFQIMETLYFDRGVPPTPAGQGLLAGIVATLFGGFAQGGIGPVAATGVPGVMAMINGIPQGVNIINNPANGANGVIATISFNGAQGLAGANAANGVNNGVNSAIVAPLATIANGIVLYGAFPVMSGYIVGYVPPPAPTHPLLVAATPQQTTISAPTPRTFYINMAATSFKLHVGGLSEYSYPTFSMAEEASVTPPKCLLTTEEHDTKVDSLEETYTAPEGFPIAGKIPQLFKSIRTLVLNISLPPCKDQHKFSEWAEKSAETLMSSLFVRTTLRRFPALRTLDFYVPGDHKINPKDTMVTKHFRNVYIRDTDGITLNFSQMALLEEYIQSYIIKKDIRGGGKAPLVSRLVVWVPEMRDRMEWEANFD